MQQIWNAFGELQTIESFSSQSGNNTAVTDVNYEKTYRKYGANRCTFVKNNNIQFRGTHGPLFRGVSYEYIKVRLMPYGQEAKVRSCLGGTQNKTAHVRILMDDGKKYNHYTPVQQEQNEFGYTIYYVIVPILPGVNVAQENRNLASDEVSYFLKNMESIVVTTRVL